MQGRIVLADNLEFLPTLEAQSVRLIYVDPPFNTGNRQKLDRIAVERSPEGKRAGFAGVRYSTKVVSSLSYGDRIDDYLGFLGPRLQEAYRILAKDGSLFVHLDSREVHYVKVWLDALFGRASFMNEIVWAYDYGGRSRKRWSTKHDTILWYARDPKNYVYRYEDIDRVPYMAPRLVGPEKAKRGKTPTDVWWHTIVPTSGKERTGYPTQKPLGIVQRIINVHSDPGDTVLDFFAGSGTTGQAAALANRNFILVDNNPEAIQVMQTRLKPYNPITQ